MNGIDKCPTQQVILVAEDSDDDVALIRRAFSKANLTNPLQFVRDGKEAIAYLKGEAKYANRDEYPLPALMLLDLDMPEKNGFEVLKWIREQPNFGSMRVLVLTSSDHIHDVNLASVSVCCRQSRLFLKLSWVAREPFLVSDARTQRY